MATQDEQSALGWTPTQRLIQQIAKQATRPLRTNARPANSRDEALVDLLLDIAQPHGGFSIDFLGALGLLRPRKDGWMPTPLLHDLIVKTSEENRRIARDRMVADFLNELA